MLLALRRPASARLFRPPRGPTISGTESRVKLWDLGLLPTIWEGIAVQKVTYTPSRFLMQPPMSRP
jgi:hypothetical protein